MHIDFRDFIWTSRTLCKVRPLSKQTQQHFHCIMLVSTSMDGHSILRAATRFVTLQTANVGVDWCSLLYFSVFYQKITQSQHIIIVTGTL